MAVSKVVCMVCGAEKKSIGFHLKKHNISSKLYKELFPKSELVSEDTKNKDSISHTGKKLSEETKKRISVKHKGKVIKEETRLKISQTKRGKKLSPETLEKRQVYYSLHGHPSKGKKILIEVFSDYFKIKQYGSIDSYKKEREEVFSKHGLKTLFFTYDEIKCDPIKCIDVIKEELK